MLRFEEDFTARLVSIMKSSTQLVTADYKRVKGVINYMICVSNVLGL